MNISRIFLGIGAISAFYMLFMQGFAFPSLPPFMSLFLRIICALCTQIFFLSFKNRFLRMLPLTLTSLLAFWGLWLFCASPAWQFATFGSYLADYAAPAISCGLVWVCGALCR